MVLARKRSTICPTPSGAKVSEAQPATDEQDGMPDEMEAAKMFATIYAAHRAHGSSRAGSTGYRHRYHAHQIAR
jgi:hypothetical protein